MGTSVWTGPVILTLCLSVLALLISITATVWQVISWRRSGAWVTVTSTWGFAGELPFISIEMTNSGRLATEINRIGFQLSAHDDREHVVMLRDVLGDLVTMPIPLAAGGTVSKMFAASAVLEVLDGKKYTAVEVRPYVMTGHGRVEGEQFDLRGRAEKLVAVVERGAS